MYNVGLVLKVVAYRDVVFVVLRLCYLFSYCICVFTLGFRCALLFVFIVIVFFESFVDVMLLLY